MVYKNVSIKDQMFSFNDILYKGRCQIGSYYNIDQVL